MKNLCRIGMPPAYIDRYKSIVAAKKQSKTKETLEDLAEQVAARYVEYENAFNANMLHTLAEDKNMRKNVTVLQHCFKKPTKPLREIFKAVVTAQGDSRILQKCPYCGITLPGTYDHYVPETPFPEFSAHALNLVPSCGKCNSKKSANWKDGNRRLFVNYYCDPLPDEQYLHVTLATKPNSKAVGARFRLERAASIADNALWNLIESHFQRLELLDRYSEQVDNEVSEIFDSCVAHLQDGGNDVVHFLNIVSSSHSAIFGVNHWRVVLWRALSADQNFCQLVQGSV